MLNHLKDILHIVTISPVQTSNLADTYYQFEKNIDQFDSQLDQLRSAVQQLIEQQEPEYFQNSLKRYHTNQRNIAIEQNQKLTNWVLRPGTPAIDIFSEKIQHAIAPETLTTIQERLRMYADWRHPGMVIRPIYAQFVENLVACDPMYFVDTSDQFQELTKSWFTPEYQRRLRRYVVNESDDQDIFLNLPVNQFGLIYAFHFFEHRPWSVLQRYLKECFELLRPGGVLAFTYNNCDIANRVGAVEYHAGCYTPGRLVRKYVLELGYETVFDLDDDTNTSWMELRRPGDYVSIRGGQTLAAILQRT
jgi:hypothetical protein